MQGFNAPDIARPFMLYDRSLQKIEDALQDSKWLAGDTFALADVGMAAYLNRLDMLGMPEQVDNEAAAPGAWTKSH